MTLAFRFVLISLFVFDLGATKAFAEPGIRLPVTVSQCQVSSWRLDQFVASKNDFLDDCRTSNETSKVCMARYDDQLAELTIRQTYGQKFFDESHWQKASYEFFEDLKSENGIGSRVSAPLPWLRSKESFAMASTSVKGWLGWCADCGPGPSELEYNLFEIEAGSYYRPTTLAQVYIYPNVANSFYSTVTHWFAEDKSVDLRCQVQF